MASAYYSTVFTQSADEIWNVIRDFNNYPVWVDGSGESEIEGGKTGDAVGAVRNVLYQGKRIRQTLLALSDIDRAQTYAFCGEAPMPVRDYRATLRSIARRSGRPSGSCSSPMRSGAGWNRCSAISTAEANKPGNPGGSNQRLTPRSRCGVSPPVPWRVIWSTRDLFGPP